MPSSWSQEKYIRSLRFAAEAHRGQTVPGTDLPYVIHATLVAMEVMAALVHEDGLDGDLAVQCALLHDVIEDTKKTHADLASVFGERVADGVLALSKNEKVGMEIDDRYERKKLKMLDCLSRIKKQPHEIGIVKLADRITNFQPPPKGWNDEKIKRYREEGKLILSELSHTSLFLSERLREKLCVYPLGR